MTRRMTNGYLTRSLSYLLLLAPLFVTCVTPAVFYTPVTSSSYFAPKDPARVVVYSVGYRPDRRYETMGKIAVWGHPHPGKTSPIYRNKTYTPEEVFDIMRREAAARGGDAVIDVEMTSTRSEVSEFDAHGSLYGFGAHGYKGTRTSSGYIGWVVRWVDDR